MNRHIALTLLVPALLACAPFQATGAEPEVDHSSPSPDEDVGTEDEYTLASPDKRWEYRVLVSPANSGNEAPVIVKAGTTEVMLKLSEEAHKGTVVWSPDSRRFAFNYRAGSRYDTTELCQLRAGKWELLRSPEVPETTRPLKQAMDAQARKAKLSRGAHRRRIWDSWTLRRWVNANTAELHVSSTESVPAEEQADLQADFLFTLRFDDRGRWTVIRTRKLTKKESEAMDAK